MSRRSKKPGAKNNSASPGRTPRPVDEKLVRSLAEHFCSVDEIAKIVGVGTRQIQRRFGEILQQEHAKVSQSIKRKTIQEAMKTGNPTLLIWCGKVFAGLKENLDVTSGGKPFVVEVVRVKRANGNSDRT